MDKDSERNWSEDNRAKKVAGRHKRKRYVQGTRAFVHAMTNSMAKRFAERADKRRGSENNQR